MSGDRLVDELERIVEISRPEPGAFDRLERRVRRHRLRERAFAGVIAAAVVVGTVVAYLQLPASHRAATVTPPPPAPVEGVWETRVTQADLSVLPGPALLSPRDADFLVLGTGRLRLVLQSGMYRLIFYQDRRGPLYLRNAGTYTVHGSRLVLRSVSSYRPTVQQNGAWSRIELRWSLADGLLRLVPTSTTEPFPENRAATRVMFGAHLWHRVG